MAAIPINRWCPNCGQGLVIQQNRKTKRQFIGCSSWPDCDYTEPNVPEDLKMRAAGQMELFSLPPTEEKPHEPRPEPARMPDLLPILQAKVDALKNDKRGLS